MKYPSLSILFILSLCTGACQSSPQIATQAVPVDSAPVEESATTRTLTICLAYEPESLYPYAAVSQAARDVLQAIYDGHFTEEDGKSLPAILATEPETGSAPVSVQAGMQVVDIHGQVVSLQAGTRVFPSGCASAKCAITWDGSSELLLDQPFAVFRLLEGLTWSDGQPLSAADSIYSYMLASDPATPNDKTAVNQTASYYVLDETTIRWSGLPGLVSENFKQYFFQPMPQHAWSAFSAAQLLTAEQSTRRPLGWGAYIVDEWKTGEYIRLVKNPAYFRAAEGLPKFDTLVFKITDGYGDTNLANLKFNREPYAQFKYDLGEFDDKVAQNGCDLISSTVDMGDQLQVLNILLNYFSDPAVKVTDGTGSRAAWLLFNRRTGADGAAALFDKTEMRQAAAACLERAELAESVFHNLVTVPDAFTFSDNPASPNAALAPDPARGQALLTEMGWQAGEPRAALDVAGVPDGSALEINYLTEDDSLSLAAAQQVKSALSGCGFQVNLVALPAHIYWDKNSTQSIFQGNWDLAQMNWELPLENPCPLVASANIPGVENNYAGLNFSAFSDARVDEICDHWEVTPLTADNQALLTELQDILNRDLAIIPLFTYSNLMVARVDFCDFNTQAPSELAGIESFDYGVDCLP